MDIVPSYDVNISELIPFAKAINVWLLSNLYKASNIIYVLDTQSKEEGKDQKSIQSNTTPEPGHHT